MKINQPSGTDEKKFHQDPVGAGRQGTGGKELPQTKPDTSTTRKVNPAQEKTIKTPSREGGIEQDQFKKTNPGRDLNSDPDRL